MILDPHDIDPAKVLALVSSMGGRPGRLMIVGCEPTPMAEPAELAGELTEPVRQAVDRAIELIRRLVAEQSAP